MIPFAHNSQFCLELRFVLMHPQSYRFEYIQCDEPYIHKRSSIMFKRVSKITNLSIYQINYINIRKSFKIKDEKKNKILIMKSDH
jgi:hypothetical protein